MATAISQFRNRVIPYVKGCPIPAIDRAVVDAMRQMCEETNCLTKTMGATGNYDADFPYVLPFDFGESDNEEFYIVTVTFADYTMMSGLDPIMLTYLNIEETDYDFLRLDLDEEVSDLEQITPSGSKFYRFPSKETIEIFPFDSGESTVTMTLTLSVKPSDGETSVDDRFYDEWRDPVIALACSNLQMIPKRDWTDYEQAQINMNKYENKRSEISFRRHSYVHRKARFSGGYI